MIGIILISKGQPFYLTDKFHIYSLNIKLITNNSKCRLCSVWEKLILNCCHVQQQLLPKLCEEDHRGKHRNYKCEVTIGEWHVKSLQSLQWEDCVCRSVPAGEELTICYTDVLMPTSARQETFLSSKHFTCQCSRCSQTIPDCVKGPCWPASGTDSPGEERWARPPHMVTPPTVWLQERLCCSDQTALTPPSSQPDGPAVEERDTAARCLLSSLQADCRTGAYQDKTVSAVDVSGPRDSPPVQVDNNILPLK